MKENLQRLFFGAEVHTPWPSNFPKGRLLKEEDRHLTLSFLGNISLEPLKDRLEEIPHPPCLGEVGYFDSCVFLPPHHENVVAWHVNWLRPTSSYAVFQKSLANWLTSSGYTVDLREWNPHVTLCRKPFHVQQWKDSFLSLPFYASGIHLYESLGNLTYRSLWNIEIPPPFMEVEHDADWAFLIYGENLQQIYLHSFIALAFKIPQLLPLFEPINSFQSLDEIIISLNKKISQLDSESGCLIKAVSFHGSLCAQNSLLQWEMIVDV